MRKVSTVGVVVPLRETRTEPASIQNLVELTAEGMQAVNQVILDKAEGLPASFAYVSSRVEEAYRVANWHDQAPQPTPFRHN